MERKTLDFAFEIKEAEEDGDKGIVEGYASVFGNIDQGLDIVEHGAFKKTLKESKGKVPILSHHNPYKQIGWNLEAKEDDRGLAVRGEFDIKNNATALEHFSLIKMAKKIKAKAGLSIGYYPIKKDTDPKNPSIRRLKELRLFEWSPVTFAMNTEASATNAKHFNNLENDINFMIEDLRSRGYNTSEIKSSLAKQAETLNINSGDNDDEAQSILKQLEQLTKNLTGA